MSRYQSDADVLRELLNPQMIVECEPGTNGYTIILVEQKNASKVKITNLPEDAFVIKPDEFSCTRSPSELEIADIKAIKDAKEQRAKSARARSAFQGKYGENTCADYVILSPSKRIIMYFELKSTKDTKAGGHSTSQLEGAQCFIECCKLYVSHFFEDVPSDFLSNYRQRFFKCLKSDQKYLAQDTSRRMRLTRHRSQKEPVPDTPSKAYSTKDHELSFKRIAWLGCN